ncbi:MAG: hypothetical protein ACKV2O_06335 [Acidimicrobiales bacterium]
MASPSVQQARPVHDESAPVGSRAKRGLGLRFEAGFSCAVEGGNDQAPAAGSSGGGERVTGSARRCQRRLAVHLRQHRDLLSCSANSRRSLQAALEDLGRWDRRQYWSRQVLIENLPVTYWLGPVPSAPKAPANG